MALNSIYVRVGRVLQKTEARLTLDLVVRWEKPDVRQWDASCVPVIELYCDEITIFLQIQGSCGMGEQKMGLGTNIRVQTACKGSGDMGKDRGAAAAARHLTSPFLGCAGRAQKAHSAMESP